ncbi:MAG TPA: ROK family protein [Chthoniobacteraceae bacterium]
MKTPPTALLAIEIGGSKLQLFAGRGDGKILDRRRFVVDRDAGGAGIRAQIAAALPELIERWQPGAIGVGYGGPVDWRRGRITRSYHIAGWDDFPLGQWLTDQSSLPVYIENDANTAALGEALHGAGIGLSPVFYVTLGSGVGGGLVIEGKVFHGAKPGEVEIGHVRLERDGTIVEDRCSGWSLDRLIRGEVEQAPESFLTQLVRSGPSGAEARHLGPALAAGDPLAFVILRKYSAELAFVLSHVAHLLHPHVIVLGGGVALIGEPLRAAVAETLPRFIMDAFQPGPRIALAALREDAVPVGALALAARGFSDGKG